MYNLPMSKIRVDAEPLVLSQKDIYNGFVQSATFKMPLVHFGTNEVDPVQKVKLQLTQPVRLRHNLRDEHGNEYHLKLTRFNSFRVMVPVILAEIEEPTEGNSALTTSTIGCI